MRYSLFFSSWLIILSAFFQGCNWSVLVLIFQIAQQPIENVDPNNQQPQATQNLDYTNISIKRQKRDIRHDEDNELNKDNNISNITENISPTSPSASSTSASTGYDGKHLKNIINLCLFSLIYTNLINIIKLM